MSFEVVVIAAFCAFMVVLFVFLGWAAHAKVNADFVRDWELFSRDWDRRHRR